MPLTTKNMKIKKRYGDKIQIDWVDAYTEDGWKTVDEALKISDVIYCYTNAFFLGQTKDFVLVVHTKGKTNKNDVMGKLTIPKAWIRKIR